MICVAKSPRRLFYTLNQWVGEIEYPSDIPTPTPEITVNYVQVTVPPAIPGYFYLWALHVITGQYRLVYVIYSFSMPWIQELTWGGSCYHRLWGINQFGVTAHAGTDGRSYYCGSAYITPGSTQALRCDLLVGSDRIINPAINTPCPTWRLAGGICPPDTIPCDDECMPCDSLVARIQALMV